MTSPPWPAPHPFANERLWLDCLIEREIMRLRARYELSLDELRGLYVSDHQVDELLHRQSARADAHGPAAALTVQAACWRAHFAADSPLTLLGERLALGETACELVLVAAAPELDLRYETLYAYLNNDSTRKSMTLDLARRLLDGEPADLRAQVQALMAAGVFEPHDPAERRSSLAQCLTLARPVVQFLLGVHPAPLELEPVDAAPAEARAELIACRADDDQRQRQWAHALLALRGRHALHLAPAALEGTPDPVLLARLAGAALVVHEHPGDGLDLPAATRISTVLASARAAQQTVLWLAPRHWQPAPPLAALGPTVLDLPPASVQVRCADWAAALVDAQLPGALDAELPSALGARFAFGAARIRQAIDSARALCDADPSVPDARGAVERAARQLAARPLARVAQHATKPHSWSQLVLAPTTVVLLREVAGAIGKRRLVFHDWNMQARTGRSAGLMLLFSGASGTGKTMAASVLANEAGLDLYRIDLAGVVSKYIGETEKNLDRIFGAAVDADALLLFDEADALLGKRAEVKEAHDRYANIEVAYLLQKMEEHDGVVILASNLPKNLDQAFSRRMHYVVEFARPGPALREQLWRGIFPPELPLEPGIDFAFLAEQFELTGGDIQTIALEAAFLAAGEGRPLAMAHLMRALARRQTKHGDPGTAARFRTYQETVRP